MNPNPYDPPQTDPALRPEPPVLAAVVGESGGMGIDFELQRDDLVAFALFHQKHSPAARKQRRQRMVIWGGVLIVLIATFIRRGFFSSDDWLLVACTILFLVGLFVSLPQIREWRLRKAIARMYGEGRNVLLYGPRRVVLTPQSLINSSANSQSETRWIAIEKIVVTEEALYIYISSVSSVVIPRREFTSNDHFQTFIQTAQDFHTRALAAENSLNTSS